MNKYITASLLLLGCIAYIFLSNDTGSARVIVNLITENIKLNDVINVGGAVEFTIKEVAQLIIKKTNSKSKIIHLPALKEGDMTRRLPDNSKMIQKFYIRFL